MIGNNRSAGYTASENIKNSISEKWSNLIGSNYVNSYKFEVDVFIYELAWISFHRCKECAPNSIWEKIMSMIYTEHHK